MFRLRSATRRGWRVAAVVSLSLGLAAPVFSPGPAGAQALLPPTASAAPQSTTILYHQVDLDREGVQWQQVDDLLARVGVPDALDSFEREMLAEGARQGDFTQADFDALFGGEMAIVVTTPAIEHFMTMMAMMDAMDDDHHRKGDRDKDGTPGPADAGMMATPGPYGPGMAMGVAAVLQPGDLDGAWDYVLRQFDAAAADTGLPLLEETNDGAEVLVIEGEMPRDKKGKKHHGDMDAWMGGMDDYPLDPRHGLAAARAGAFIVAGKSRDDVNAIVDVIQGEEASLVESTAAQRVRAQMPSSIMSFTYVNSAAIVDALGPEMMEAWVTSMGGASVDDARVHEGIAVSAEPIGFRFDMVAMPEEGATLSTAAVANDPDILARAEQAPADTFLFMAGDLPENAFAGAAYGLATAINAAEAGDDGNGHDMMMAPPSAEEMQAALEEATATLGFNPQTELFDLLGGNYVAMASLPSFSMTGFGWDAVAAIGTTDADALADTAQRFAAFIDRSDEGIDVATRQEGGNTVYAVSDPDMAEAPAVEFGVVGDQAVVGVGDGIARLGAAPAESLAADEQFQTVMGALPSEAYQIAYADLGQFVDLVTMLMAMGGDESAATPVAAGAGSPENIRAFGAANFSDGAMAGASAILYIAGGE